MCACVQVHQVPGRAQQLPPGARPRGPLLHDLRVHSHHHARAQPVHYPGAQPAGNLRTAPAGTDHRRPQPFHDNRAPCHLHACAE